ncbi:MAG: HDOD domain-containing protein [Vicinamibacterales bacterium]
MSSVQPMPTDTSSRDAVVALALARSSNLAMLPETATRVLRLADDPYVTMAKLADVIETSPELCARILRIVNSAFYGFPGEVRSIQHATTLMGLEAVRNVTIAASLTRVFQGRPLSPKFSPKDIWTHSLSVAAATRQLACIGMRSLADEAFLAGMLHDIGLMVELQLDRPKLAAHLGSIETGRCTDLLAAEEAAFGATHADFGAALLAAWHLPTTMSLSAQYHHRPHQLPAAHRLMPVMVHLGDRLVAACGPPFLLDDPSPEIDPALLDVVHVSPAQVEELRAALPDVIAEVKAVLSAA